MGLRKTYRDLTNQERGRFVDALFQLKRDGIVDRFAELHRRHFFMNIHRSSHFLPWHREMLEGHGWGMALDVPETWWEGLDVVDRVLVTAGWEEVFRDHVAQLANVLRRKTRVKQFELLMAMDEAHDAPLMSFLPPGRDAN